MPKKSATTEEQIEFYLRGRCDLEMLKQTFTDHSLLHKALASVCFAQVDKIYKQYLPLVGEGIQRQ